MILLTLYISVIFTWVFYLALMNLKRNREELSIVTKIFAYPMIVIGVSSDVLFNFFWGSILFLELPKEWLMTTRLKRHLNDHKKDWRDRNANWFCRHFLNPFDPTGNHC